jgi:hypothetical protein
MKDLCELFAVSVRLRSAGMTSLACELGLVPGDLYKKGNEENLQRYNVASTYHVFAKLCSTQVTPSITTLPRRAVPGDCHRSDVCRTAAIASPRYRLRFRRLPQPRSCCVPSKSNATRQVIFLTCKQPANEHCFSLRGDTSTLRFCGYPSPRREVVNVTKAANLKLDALHHSQAS